MNHGGGDIMMSVFVGVGRALRWDLLTSDLCLYATRLSTGLQRCLRTLLPVAHSGRKRL